MTSLWLDGCRAYWPCIDSIVPQTSCLSLIISHMKYVVCAAADLLDAPNGKMAREGAYVFDTEEDAIRWIPQADYYNQDVFACDATNDHVFVSTKTWQYQEFTSKPLQYLKEARYVSETSRMTPWITICNMSRSDNAPRIAILSYVFASASIPFMVCPQGDSVSIKCLRKDRDVVAALSSVSANCPKFEMPPLLEIAIAPADAKSTFDLV